MMRLQTQNRWWVLHEDQLGAAFVRCYNQELTPSEALALFLEHANDGDDEEEAEE